ncbi:MAG: hypothetical protein RLP15_04650 [Cryomorphaceae bacterium]
MPKKITYLLILFLLLSAMEASAQGYFWQSGQKKQHYKYLSVDAGLGLRMYSGDIQQKGALFNPLRFAYGIGARYQYRPRLGFALHAGARGYKGKADHGGFPDALDDMSGKLWEFSLMTQFSILRWEDFTQRMFTDRDPVRRMNVFLGVGAGGALFNASYTSRKYVTKVFQDTLGRDSMSFVPIDNSGSGAGFAFHVPVVLGGRYRFNPSWFMSFELHYDVYFSDNLDGLKRGRNDGMGLAIVKVGYAFGQPKKKGTIGMTPKQKRKLKK